LKFVFRFTILLVSMQTLPAVFEPVPAAQPRAMTRCECAGVSFQEIARKMAAEGASIEEACRRTGCGLTCTACVPDLVRALTSR
jgi:NAD(P)H-nitrite reductase large subunit